MRFIRGDSLKDAIERFHQADGPRRDPGERSLALRELLGRFVDVCNAVAYAHSRGVLHRDLKPGNVMLGIYGETLVVDWGLAKVASTLVANATTPENLLRPASSGATPTVMGQALGTPAFMSPEQAAGRLDQLGPASDVYSLGATFYCLLTGRAPVAGIHVGEVLQRVQEGEYPRPRLVKREVPAALEAIGLKAMALRPEERYRSPRELAADIEHWLADEPVSAYREPLLVRARRWARRHKPLVTGVSAMVLTAMILGGGGGWWVQQQRQARMVEAQLRQRDAEQKAASSMEQARKALAEGWEKQDAARLAEARAEADKAVTVARSDAGDEVRAAAGALMAEVQAKTAQTEQNQRLRVALLDVTKPRETKAYEIDESGRALPMAEPSAEEQFAAAFHRWGTDVDKEPAEQSVARLLAQAKPVMQEVVAGLDEWAQVRRQAKSPEGEWRRLSDLANQLDGDPRRQELRRLWENSTLQQERLAIRAAEALAPSLGISEVFVGARTSQLRELARKMDLATEPVLGVVSLARALQQAGDAPGAESVFRAALAARPDDVVLLDGMGKLLEAQQPPRWGEAIECYRAARAARPQLGFTLARALSEVNRTPEAEAVLRDVARRQPDNPEAYFHLGNALAAQKKHAEAEAAFRETVRLQPNDVAARGNLGIALDAQKKYEEAVAVFHETINLQPDAKVYDNLGNALRHLKKLDEAEAAFRRAIELNSKDALAYYNLGVA
jgi:tetratricopeptide (TPR) repeat protein